LAERELIAAARFYETRASGLGANFIRQIERTLADVVLLSVIRPQAGQVAKTRMTALYRAACGGKKG
jgi:hypothetical protein